MTLEEIETEYWAYYYDENPSKEMFEDDDFDYDAYMQELEARAEAKEAEREREREPEPPVDDWEEI